MDTGRVYYVFKDFPIAGLHPLAHRLHEATLCVGEQGGSEAYWQTHDLFFSNAETFQVETLAVMDEAILAELAANDLPDISQCLAAGDYADEVQAGVSEGQRLGINGTPAFFVNGYPISGAQPYDLFEYAIELAEVGRIADAYRPAAPNDGKSIHPQALKAHEAARCAREWGGDEAYWTMHDLLFANQDAWASRPLPDHVVVLKELAGQAGIPQNDFDECLDSGRYEEAVLAELAEGTQLGVRSTPAFFLNGLPLSGAQPYSVFQQAIEQLLALEE